MDQRAKTKIVEIKKRIQTKQFQEALDLCEIFILTVSNKIASVHLFAGFCQEKLKNDGKAEQEYKEAEELEPENVDCFKALYNLYTRLKNPSAAIYLHKLCRVYKKTDKAKFREHYIKLVKYYETNDQLETIHKMIKQTMETEKEITPEFVALMEAYFKLSTDDKSFDLNLVASMGIGRTIIPESKEALDLLLVKSIKYLKSVAKEYGIEPQQISNSILYFKESFPESSAILFILLLDDYTVTHVEPVEALMNEIYLFLAAHFESKSPQGQNCYTNSEYIHPQIFVTSAILSYQYLSFFVEFFSIAEPLKPLYSLLAAEQDKLKADFLSEELKGRINEFVLTEALELSRKINAPDAYNKLNNFRERAKKFGGFVEEVVARLAMKVFKDYKELNDMKNILKIRINKQPNNYFLLKYYYDYLIRISRVFKVFDEQIDIEEVLDKIIKLDPQDHRYRAEKVWLQFSQIVHQHSGEVDTYKELLNQMHEINKAENISKEDKATLEKKILLIDIHCKKTTNIHKKLLEIADIDPKNYHTFICLGVERYIFGEIPEALTFFKRAFAIYQRDYHINRYLYLCLIKLSQIGEAEKFVEKIYPAFRNIFWVNQVLAISCINSRQYEQAESYLTKAIEIFVSNKTRTYNVSFEKIHEREDYSSPYLIRQNKYRILDEYFTIPEARIFEDMPFISNYYYSPEKNRLDIIEIRMWVQMAEILKILGRLSSALKCVTDARELARQAGFFLECEMEAASAENETIFLQMVLLLKEQATVLYYYLNIKEAERICGQALEINSKLLAHNKKYTCLTSELLALKFEIAIQRLSNTMKFESYETTSKFISSLKIPECKNPSVPYMKSLYQYRLLCYIHNQTDPKACISALGDFLQHFGLDYEKPGTTEFCNAYFKLRQEDRKQVREAVEDLSVFLYINACNNGEKLIPFGKEQILVLLELFSESPILYILYGIMEEDLGKKTGAFLKCIQIDKYNPVSIDYLAYLYLKNKNLLGATKLYLKSIELNPFNLKSYIGITITLFSIVTRCLSSPSAQTQSLIQTALNKVNAYIEYLKVTNPSLQFNIVEFFQMLLIGDDTTNATASEFNKAIRLNSGMRAYLQFKKTGRILESEFVNKVLQEIPVGELWKSEGKVVVEKFAKEYNVGGVAQQKDIQRLIDALTLETKKRLALLQQSKTGSDASKEAATQTLQAVYNRLNVAVCLSQRVKITDKCLHQILELVEGIKGLQSHFDAKIYNDERVKQLKNKLLNNAVSADQKIKDRIEAVFEGVETPEFAMKEAFTKGQPAFRKCITRTLLLDPTNEEARRHLSTILTTRHRKYIVKMREDPKARLLNESLESKEKRIPALTRLVALYNDPSGWVMLIHEKFKIMNQRTEKNLRYWLKTLQINSIFKNPTHQLYAKCQSLFVEIYLWFEKNYSKWDAMLNIIMTNQKLKATYEVLSIQKKLYTGPSQQLLIEVCKKVKPQHQTKLLLNTLNSILSKFKVTRALVDSIQKLEETVEEGKDKTYLRILKYITAIKTQSNDQYQQYERALVLSNATPMNPLTPSLGLLQMNTSLILKQYPELDQQLSNFVFVSVQNFSQTLLACYFDIMYSYNALEQSPQDPEVFERFRNYIDHTLTLCNEQPDFASFLNYLYALAITKAGEPFGLGRKEARKCIVRSVMLQPASGKQTLSKIHRK